MKLITLSLVNFLSILFVNAQIDSLSIITINTQVSIIETNLSPLPKLHVDSSLKKLYPFTEKFFYNKKTNQLNKVEYEVLNPAVKINYYFLNDKLIKVIGLDNSTEFIYLVHIYFKDDKAIYWSRRGVDGDFSGSNLLNTAKEYLLRFKLSKKTE